VAIYKEISLTKDLPRIVRESMTLVGAILAILSTAIGFTSWLIQAQIPMKILASMQTLITSQFMFLLVLNVFLLIVGMLMDIFAAIFVVVPLIIPIARHFGVDPYHLGIVFLLNLEIGYLTPPVGLNLFISSFRFKQPMVDVYRAVLPFIGILLVTLLITTYVPQLSTFLPSLSSATDISQMKSEEPTQRGMPAVGDEPGGEGLEDLDSLGDELSLDDLDKELAPAAPEGAPSPDGEAPSAPEPEAK